MAKIFEYEVIVDNSPLDETIDKLGEVQSMSTSSTSSMTKGFESVGNAITKSSKDLSMLGSSGKSAVGGLTSGFKTFGSTMKGVGTALKTNPIMLLVAVLSPIILAVMELIGELDIVQVYFDLVGKAVEAVINVLKQLTDWLGLSSFAEQKAHDDRIAQTDKEIAKANELKAARDQAFKDYHRDTQVEIAQMKAAGASIEEIEDKEIELAKTRRMNAQKDLNDIGSKMAAEIAMLEEEMKGHKENSKKWKEANDKLNEYKKGLQDLKNAAADADAAVDLLEANISGARQQRAKADEKARQAEAQAAAKAAQSAADAANAAEETKRREAEATARKRFEVARQIEDMEIAAMENSTERELELNKVRFDRAIADTLANEELKQHEKEAMIALFEEERLRKANEINQAELANRLEATEGNYAAQKEITDKFYAGQRADVDANFEEQVRKIEENTTLSEEERSRIITGLTMARNEATAKLDEQQREQELQMLGEHEQAKADKLKEYEEMHAEEETELEKAIRETTEIFEAEQEILAEMLEMELLTREEYNEKIAAARKKMNDDITKHEEDAIKARKQADLDAELEKAAAALEMAQMVADGVNNFAQDMFKIADNLGKQDEKSKLKRAKAQFRWNKATEMTNTAISGAGAVIKGIQQFGPPPSPLGIASIAAAGIMTTASIAAIASKKFDGGGTGDTSVPDASSAISSAESAARSSTQSAPSFNLYGNANEGSDISKTEDQRLDREGNIIRAYVTESDISDTTRRLERYRQNSEL